MGSRDAGVFQQPPVGLEKVDMMAAGHGRPVPGAPEGPDLVQSACLKCSATSSPTWKLSGPMPGPMTARIAEGLQPNRCTMTLMVF